MIQTYSTVLSLLEMSKTDSDVVKCCHIDFDGYLYV